MRLTLKNIKYILIAVIIVCVAETAFMVKKNFAANEETTEESSSLDDISEEDIEELLNRKLIIAPLEDDFKMIQPLKTDFKTGEDFVTFMGMTDPNETLKINDDNVEVYYTGNFIFKKALETGDNSFTFSLGDKTVTYNINRVNGIIDYITPGDVLNVDKNSRAEISAKAYKDAEVYAMVGDEKIELKQVENDEKLAEKGTCYAEYKGYLDTSAYLEGTSLGRIKVHASLNEEEAEKEGAEVKINVTENRERIAEINCDSAQVYDSSTTSLVPLNDVYPLAKGTKDYIVSELTSDKNVFYNLASGKRVDASCVNVLPYEDLSNAVNSLEVTADNDYAYITLALSKKAPYTFITEGVDYRDKDNEDYEVSKFRLSEIKIYLNYADTIKNNISYTNNDFFDEVKYADDAAGKYLYVKLKNNSSYNGHLAYYNKNGNLVFRFTKKKTNLKDLKITVDPGHGLIEEGKTDLGSLGYSNLNENNINMQIAKKLAKVLEDEGSSVYLLDTEKTPYALKERGKQARINGSDMYISLHADASGFGNLNGVKTYYFTPFSESLAESINKNLVKCYKNELFTDSDDNFDRGSNYKNLTVTLERENPSVVVETGYINNPEVFNKLIDEKMQLKIAKYIAAGINESLK